MTAQEAIVLAVAGRSRAALAREIGLSPQMLSCIERVESACPPWVAARLAEVNGQDRVRAAIEALAATAKKGAEIATWARVLRGLE